VPFDEIAPIIERSPEAARQLASRAIQGEPTVPDVDVARQREVVDAFLVASRQGDFDALLAVLDPDVVVRADQGAVPAGANGPVVPSGPVRGAANVARRAMVFAQIGLLTHPALGQDRRPRHPGRPGPPADAGSDHPRRLRAQAPRSSR
jgi:hypothetical protein